MWSVATRLHIEAIQKLACQCITSSRSRVSTSVLTKSATLIANHQVTRWYRPPELILLQGQYSPAVDVRLLLSFPCADAANSALHFRNICITFIVGFCPRLQVWSFGCIFGELVKTLNTSQRGGPLFPGNDACNARVMVALDH